MKSSSLETILARRAWTENLFSFTITRPAGFDFVAGQFARLGLEVDGETLWRAYSIVAGTREPQLEFYSVVIPDGAFSQALNQLGPGDPIRLESASFGHMTVERLPPGGNAWLLATGTGLAPYISMLREAEIWTRYRDIILVHCARYPGELTYTSQLEDFRQRAQASPDTANLHVIQALTGVQPEPQTRVLYGRITELFTSGALEKAAGIAIDPEQSRLMLCGNPDMIEEMRVLFRARGLRPCRSTGGGHFLSENYW